MALTGTAQTRLLSLMEKQKNKSTLIIMLDNDEARKI